MVINILPILFHFSSDFFSLGGGEYFNPLAFWVQLKSFPYLHSHISSLAPYGRWHILAHLRCASNVIVSLLCWELFELNISSCFKCCYLESNLACFRWVIESIFFPLSLFSSEAKNQSRLISSTSPCPHPRVCFFFSLSLFQPYPEAFPQQPLWSNHISPSQETFWKLTAVMK